MKFRFLSIFFVLISSHLQLYAQNILSFESEAEKIIPINKKFGCVLSRINRTDSSALARLERDDEDLNISGIIDFQKQIKKWRSSFKTLKRRGKQKSAKKRKLWIKKAKACRKRSGAFSIEQQELNEPPSVDPEEPFVVSDEPCDVVGSSQTLDRVSPRILRGQKCEIGDSPVVELLFYYFEEKDPSGLCTGTVIASNKVLTAAHCIAPGLTDIEVVAGGDRSKGIYAESVRVNSNYDFSVFPQGRGDLAIITLRADINTRIINIQSNADLQKGETAIIAGYGVIDLPEQPGIAGKDVDGLRAGSVLIREVSRNELSTFYDIADPKISNTCVGDSGGPLLVKRRNEWVIAGVTSYGRSAYCSPDEISVYSKISDPENIAFLKEYALRLVR